MGELGLIESIERALRPRGDRVLTWVGDDASVVRARAVAVTSIDTVVDGVHFERSTHSFEDVGHKALATALSDLAAMGAEPGEAHVGLVLPGDMTEGEALEVVAGMESLAAATGTTIAGGDVVSGPALVVTVTVTGWLDDEEEVVTRGGAQVGDLLGVTGELGGSGAGLLLLRGTHADVDPHVRDALLDRHRRPQPLLAAGRALARAGVTSMVDVSDGVATDAGHLGRRSGAELRLSLPRLPLAAGVAEVARAAGLDPEELAATAGDDYELLFTAPPELRGAVSDAAAAAGRPVTWLGEVGPGAGAVFSDAAGRAVELAGYEHA